MADARRGIGTAALLATTVLGTALATVPTPLYPVYSAELGLDSLGVTATFAAFAGGAVIGLAASALLSARLQRRRAYLIAGMLQILAAAILAADLGLAGFTVGRVVTGLGAGLLAASGTAFILELAGGLRTRPGAVLRTLAPAFAFLGLGTGPLIAGLVAPHHISGVHALFAVVGAGIAITLLTSLLLLPRDAGRALPPARRGARLPVASGLGAFVAFMTTGLFGSLTTMLLELIGVSSPLLAGAFASLVFVSGAIGVAALAPRIPFRSAAVLLALALVAVATSVTLRIPLGLVLAAAVTGAAGGALFARSLGSALAAAPQAAFRQTSLVFAAAYTGLAVPVLGLGLVLRVVPVDVAVWSFAALAAVLCAAAVLLARRA